MFFSGEFSFNSSFTHLLLIIAGSVLIVVLVCSFILLFAATKKKQREKKEKVKESGEGNKQTTKHMTRQNRLYDHNIPAAVYGLRLAGEEVPVLVLLNDMAVFAPA
mmetsp:Transcript_24585/g.27977  ORF Transcript_24585/g.27977 Transcript_24585/m.27977 type:complete len:106 (+) Transcript_24585:1609-1926(+)